MVKITNDNNFDFDMTHCY